jgi:transcription antitermination factor NusG
MTELHPLRPDVLSLLAQPSVLRPLHLPDYITEPCAWYLAYTAYRAEFRVVQALAEQRIDAYCPAATVWRTHARKREPAPVALLPRYVFVQLHVHGPRFDLVKATDGVECLIGDKLRPSRLTAADVAALERIRADEAAGMFDTTSAAIAASPKRRRRAKRRLQELHRDGGGAAAGDVVTAKRPKDMTDEELASSRRNPSW